MPARGDSDGAVLSLAAVSGRAGTPEVVSPELVATGRPGRGEGAELVAQNSDLVVLVVPHGEAAREVAAAVLALRQYGVTVAWGLLTPRARALRHGLLRGHVAA